MEIDDIFSFEDFLSGKVSKKPKSETPNRVVEKVESELDNKSNESILQKDEIVLNTNTDTSIDDQDKYENSNPEELTQNDIQSQIDENFYPLYKDKGENFQCDIYVEGAKTDDTIARIIIETNDWTLMFPGEISNGKVTIPIRKLNIFDEGQVGKIKLEVIAEGTLFIPWEDEFKIKLSKKVSIKMDESKKFPHKEEAKTGVRVSVRK